jgi:hypothetical protein
MWPKNGRLLGWRAAAAHHLQSQIDEGVLERIVREYLTPITATGGHSGGFISGHYPLICTGLETLEGLREPAVSPKGCRGASTTA